MEQNEKELSKKLYGEPCRLWRTKEGLSQEVMAQQLGLRDGKTYQRYESGDSPFTLPLLEAIAQLVKAGTVSNLLSISERLSFHNSPQSHTFSSTNTYNESGAKEREQLLARITHLEEEVVHTRKSEEFLREQLRGKK